MVANSMQQCKLEGGGALFNVVNNIAWHYYACFGLNNCLILLRTKSNIALTTLSHPAFTNLKQLIIFNRVLKYS